MHIRCPHCRNPVELVEEASFKDLTCPSCGSNFSLVGGESTLKHVSQTRTLGHFQLLDQVGQGAFGAVWKAKDTVLDRTVAVKVPRRDLMSPEEAEYFFRDARAAAQVKHPGIVSVYEVGRDNGTLFIASEFIEGATLDQWIKAHPPTPGEAAELVIQVAEAVQHAHERGVIHRDLKPGNILMDAAGKPHVTDFGLAKRASGEITMTVDGQVLGTPAYMSPEQARGEAHQADARSDVYSLGVILFELLTGELPFRGNKQMLVLQILNDEPPSPRKLNNRIPKDLETICLKAMAKEPVKRYQAAQELAEDLRRYLAGQPIQARPVGSVERGWRWAKRQPVVAGLLGAVVLSLAAGTVVSLMFALRAQEREGEAVAEWNRAEGEKKRAEGEKGRAQIQKTRAESEKQRADQKAAEYLAEKTRAEAEKIRAEWLLYDSQIDSARREWESQNVRIAWQHLAACRTDFRGWEHDYVHTLFNQNQRTLKGHVGWVTCIAWSPDGKRIASGDGYGRVVVWDEAGDRMVRILDAARSDLVTGVAFSPDGNKIASSTRQDPSVIIWDANSGKETIRLRKKRRSGAFNVAFSPDGQWVAATMPDGLTIWDATNGQEIRTYVPAPDGVCFSADWRQFAGGSFLDGAYAVTVWNTASGERVHVLKGHTAPVVATVFSADGKEIVSASNDRTLKVWDTATGQEKFTLRGHKEAVVTVACSPDRKWIVSASVDTTLRIWDAANGQEIRALQGHLDEVKAVCVSPDGAHIASGSRDGTVRLWNAMMDQKTATFQARADVSRVAVSPVGNQILSVDWHGAARLWDIRTQQVQRIFAEDSSGVSDAAFSSDGKRIVTAGSEGGLKIWDTASGQELLRWTGHSAAINCVTFNPRGNQIATGSNDLLKLWDAANGQELRSIHLGGYRLKLTSVAFSPDGMRIMGGIEPMSTDFVAQERSAEEDERIQKILSSRYDKTLVVWDATTGQEVFTLKGHGGGVNSVACSRDGTRIASGSLDNTIRFWDARSGKEIRTLKGHTASVNCVTFSSDGKRIASASADKTIKLWDVDSGSETLTLREHSASVKSVAFSADDRQLVSGSEDGTIKVWDASERMPNDPSEASR